jgi:cell division protein ZapA
MEESRKGVCVDIFGAEYVLKVEGDPAYIKDIAQYVDSKMRGVAATTANVSSLKVAILTALNLADELFKMKKDNAVHQKTSERMDGIIKLLESNNI